MGEKVALWGPNYHLVQRILSITIFLLLFLFFICLFIYLIFVRVQKDAGVEGKLLSDSSFILK